MSIFYCFQCDGMADADDGCSEGPRNNLICADCTDEMEAEREEADMLRGEPLDPWADDADRTPTNLEPQLSEWLRDVAKSVDSLTGGK